MKKILKKILPKFMFEIIRNTRIKSHAKRLYKIDCERFINSAFSLVKSKNKENLKAKINLHSHSIEKGLTNINFREGFGKRAYTELISTLKEYKNRGFDMNDNSYQTGLSVIDSYIKVHEGSNVNTTYLKNELDQLKTSQISNFGGVVALKKNNILDFSKSNFELFAKNRYSVRDYSNEDISIDTINTALEIATKTPNVCNRQPWNTYVIKNKVLIQKILEIQGGLPGQGNNINTLIVITSNNYYLSNLYERNQGFIDGGMYSMNLMYALHYMGLATCALNADLNVENDKAIRKLLNIPNNQNLIMFLSVGHYLNEFKVPKSQRDDYKNKTIYKL